MSEPKVIPLMAYPCIKCRNDGSAHIALQCLACGAITPAPALPAPSAWRGMESAPKDKSILLYTTYGVTYCGRYRAGEYDDPQPREVAWRCDSSGRFANPTHWQPLPAPPGKEQEGVSFLAPWGDYRSIPWPSSALPDIRDRHKWRRSSSDNDRLHWGMGIPRELALPDSL